MCEGGSDKYGIARFYKNIGNVYCQFQDYEKGADYFKTGYEHCKADRDVDTERKLLTNLTAIYIYLGKAAEARKYQRESVRLKDDGDKVNRFIVDFNGGLITAAEGRYGDAVAVFHRLAAYAVASKLPPQYECYAYQELYKAFRKAGMPDSTLFYLSKCEHTAKVHGMSHMFVEVLKDASEIYEGMGRRAESLEYKDRFLAMSDSIFNLRKFDAVKNTKLLSELDPTRLIDSTSGWFDQGCGDFSSHHVYFKKVKLEPADRILALTEFGGYSYRVKGHLFINKRNFGYGKVKNGAALSAKIKDLYQQQILPQLDKGLSVAIYTQLSDVENETNGLLTYDRAVLKVDEKTMQEINEALRFEE